MEATNYIVVLITTANPQEADSIAKALLEKKMAACVTALHGVASSFWWQNKIASSQESLLIVKTEAGRFPDLVDTVKSLHSYQVPEIIALPIIGGNPDYLKWIDESLQA